MRLPDARVGRGTRAQSAHVRQYATISAARTPTAGGARGGTVTVGQQLQPGAPGTRLPTQGQPRPHSSKQQTSTIEFYLPDRIRHFWARFRPIQSSRRNWTCPVYPRATANEALPKRPKGAPSFPLSPATTAAQGETGGAVALPSLSLAKRAPAGRTIFSSPPRNDGDAGRNGERPSLRRRSRSGAQRAQARLREGRSPFQPMGATGDCITLCSGAPPKRRSPSTE